MVANRLLLSNAGGPLYKTQYPWSFKAVTDSLIQELLDQSVKFIYLNL